MTASECRWEGTDMFHCVTHHGADWYANDERCDTALEEVEREEEITVPDTPAAPTTQADEVFSDGVQEHRASRCRWTPSRIYPGYDSCLENGAAHYREARSTPAEALDPEQIDLIGQAISDIVRYHLLGVRFGNGVSEATCDELSQQLTEVVVARLSRTEEAGR